MTAKKDLFAEQRARMVREHLARRGIKDARVLDAMGQVPREAFVPPDERANAYMDAPLPIGQGQTISQPYIVAYMAEALELAPDDNVLEIGAGSGYGAAVLSRIAKRVVSIERIPELTEAARNALRRVHYDNVEVICGDGTLGHAPGAPYDAIVATAGGPQVPATLKAQLKIGGRLVIPVGPVRTTQRLVRVRRLDEANFSEEPLEPVRFVPLIGEQGWTG